ncbi:hypothetical protein Hanom_Chr11g01040991 [Helianthus anomalus]
MAGSANRRQRLGCHPCPTPGLKPKPQGPRPNPSPPGVVAWAFSPNPRPNPRPIPHSLKVPFTSRWFFLDGFIIFYRLFL